MCCVLFLGCFVALNAVAITIQPTDRVQIAVNNPFANYYKEVSVWR